MIISHSAPLNGGVEPLAMLSGCQIDLGRIAVDLFLCISGYLVAHSRAHSTAINYLAKRFLRVWPGYVVACLVSLLIFGFIGATDRSSYFANIAHMRPWKILLKICLLQEMPHPEMFTSANNCYKNGLNGSLWTIAYEVVFYLVLFLLWFSKTLRNKWSLLVLTTVSYAYFIVADCHFMSFEGIYGAQFLPRLLTCFLLGATAYCFNLRFKGSVAIVLLLSFVLAMRFRYANLIAPISLGYTTFYLAFCHWLKCHEFGKRADLSYGTYLYGFPIQQCVAMYLHPMLNQWGACLLSLVAASAAAAVSWHCIEQPCLSLKRRLDQFKPRHRTRNLGAPALPPKIEETSLMGATK